MMAVLVFDPGKVLLFFVVIVFFITSTCAQYTCVISRNGFTTQCKHPCCGTRPNQFCCEPDDEENNKLWLIIGCSVGGGLALLTIIVMAIFCCCILKNAKRAKIHNEAAGTGMAIITTNTGRQGMMSPPPAYSYHAQHPFNTQTNAIHVQQQGVAGPSTGLQGAAPVNEGAGGPRPESQVFHPPPKYSSVEKDPTNGRKQ